MADPVPSVSIGTGLNVVTATAPVLTAAENDLFCARGQAIPIASRDSPTQITLKQPWPVASLVAEQAFNILSLGEYWRSAITINRRFADLLAKWEVVNPFKFDAAGTLAQRDGYNNQPKGFVYISFDPLPVRIFVKLANTNSSADWSAPIYIGAGGQVEYQEALDRERQQRIQADAVLGKRIDDLAVGSDPNVRADLNAEISRSTGKDAQHDTQIAGLRTDLTAEAATRGAKDAALDSRIDGEAAARLTGDINLTARGDAEEAARKAADTALGARLTTAEGAITALDTATLFSRQTVAESGEPALDIIDQQGNVLARFDASSLALARLLVGGVLEISPTSADGSRQIDERGFIGQVQDRAGMAVGRLTVADALEIGAATSGKGMLLGDERGFIGQVMDSRGLGLPGVTIQECAPGVAFALVDPAGWVGLAQIVGGPLRVAVVETGEAGGGSAYSTSEIAERNARALAISDSIRSRNDTTIVGPIFEFLLFLVLGQSLGAGQECTPAKSKTPVPDVLMLGDCVRSISGDYTTYDVVGASVLNPMVARVQDRGSGTILTDAQIAALAPGANVLGESPGEGAVRFARRLYLQHRGMAADPDCRWVLGNAAVPGASVQQLQKGYSPEQFNRSRDWATKVKAAAQADTPGATIGLGAIFWLQGERNYDGSGPVPTDKASYKVVLKKLYDDTVTDVMTGILGQADPAVMITYQTSGNWARDGVAIGQAQYELSLENAGWYLAAPAYPVTNKAGGHLDANGSRWLGAQMGKVWHEVVVRRRGWRPTSPLRATWRGAEILVDFHVPAPPLQWQLPYVETTATDYPAKGFAVTDAGGAVDVLRVTLAGDAVVRIVCARPLTGSVSVIYGNQTGSAGNGCLCDSDPTVSLDKYEYMAGSGDYAEANIPALVGKPYPLWNWCIAFNITATRG